MGKSRRIVRVTNADAFAKTASYPSALENDPRGLPENGRNVAPSTVSSANSGMSVRLEQGQPPVYVDDDTKQEIVDRSVGQTGETTTIIEPDHYVEKVKPPKELLEKYGVVETPPVQNDTKAVSPPPTQSPTMVPVKKVLGTDRPAVSPTERRWTDDLPQFENHWGGKNITNEPREYFPPCVAWDVFKQKHDFQKDDETFLDMFLGFLSDRISQANATCRTSQEVLAFMPTNVLIWAIRVDDDWAAMCLDHPNKNVSSEAVMKLFKLPKDADPRLVEAYIAGYKAARK